MSDDVMPDDVESGEMVDDDEVNKGKEVNM